METRSKLCQRCQKAPPDEGLRFCADCARLVHGEMVRSGYLTEEPPPAPPDEDEESWQDAWATYTGQHDDVSSPDDDQDDDPEDDRW
jgi:predicted amidophosphoribosyltransferase